MIDLPQKTARKVLGIDHLEHKIRPKLRPIGVLAASIIVTAMVSYGIGGIAFAIIGEHAFHSAQMFSTGAAKAISLLVILVLASDDFDLRKFVPGRVRWWSVPAGVVVGAGLFALEWICDSASLPISDLVGRVTTPEQNMVLAAALSALTLAVSGGAEEILFRGLIQSSAEKYYNRISAIVLTSLLFAGPHLNFGWLAFIELFAVGLAFSWYRQAAGSLMLPITIHAVHNLLYGVAIILTY